MPATRILPALLELAVGLGVDRERLLVEAGIDSGDEPDDGLRPPALGRLIEAAIRRTGDDILLLRVAREVTKEAHGIVSHLAYSSELLSDALHVIVRHFALCCDLVLPTLTFDETACSVEFASDGPAAYMSARARASLTECAGAILLFHLRNAAGNPLLRPLSVSFRHAPPSDCAMHTIVFGVVPRFGAERDVLRLPLQLLELPCARPDTELKSVLEPYAEMLHERRYEDAPYTERTQAAVKDMLPLGEPRIEGVAKRLHLGMRSLQRRLREEGTSFSMIVDSVRHSMAMLYLERQPELSVGEVAYRLGFADVSSFHRAFRRWTGRTVRANRRHDSSGGRLTERAAARG
jgi:AraC-like DNA-binding protein